MQAGGRKDSELAPEQPTESVTGKTSVAAAEVVLDNGPESGWLRIAPPHAGGGSADNAGGTAGFQVEVSSRAGTGLFLFPLPGQEGRPKDKTKEVIATVTEEQKKKMKIQARMFDMGHAPKERVVNRVVHRVARDEQPSDERLREALADENTHEDIQNLYG